MFKEGIKLNEFSNYKIGGPARFFFRAENLPEIEKALDRWRKTGAAFFILGGGTNVLFDDDGFDGLVLKPDFREIEIREDSVCAGAGVLMSQLVDYFLENGFSGLEWAGGLPGTLGGAIRGNAGAFGGEIKDLVEEVVSVDISSRPAVIKRSKDDCLFSYRNSIFKKQSPSGMNPKEIIIDAVLRLKKGDKALMRDIIQKNVDYRKERQPLEYPNIGSIFKNVNCEKIGKDEIKKFESEIKTDPFPVVPAAYLISEAGLKGISSGGAMISPKHPNFIVNALQASSNDVKNLINLAKSEVKNKFGIDLEEEIVMFRQI
jgi:UDP-N-acetylmuramate dehydrogenase